MYLSSFSAWKALCLAIITNGMAVEMWYIQFIFLFCACDKKHYVCKQATDKSYATFVRSLCSLDEGWV